MEGHYVKKASPLLSPLRTPEQTAFPARGTADLSAWISGTRRINIFFSKRCSFPFSLSLPEPTGNIAKNNTKKFHFFTARAASSPHLSARRGSGEKKAALPHEKAAFADDAENYSRPILRAMLWAARRPAPMARMTVAAPVTMSPPAYTLGMEVSPFSSTAM